MIKFFRNNEGRFSNVLVYYIVGPVLAILFLYHLASDPRSLFDLVKTRGHYQTMLIMGIVGLFLTAKGIVRIIRKD